MNKSELAKRLVATELTIGGTEEQVTQFVRQAVQRDLLGVCVYQNMLLTALKAAEGTGLEIYTVAGFPSGIDVPITKVSDVELSAKLGAAEVDMGVNLSAWKSNDRQTLLEELKGGAAAAHRYGKRFCAVLNTYQLEDEDVEQLAALCCECGADVVKTTSGDSVIPRATEEHDVELICKGACGKTAVKAEGQIDTLKKALDIIAAGADVICSSHAFEILDHVEI